MLATSCCAFQTHLWSDWTTEPPTRRKLRPCSPARVITQPAQVAVLELRRAAREELHHPRDLWRQHKFSAQADRLGIAVQTIRNGYALTRGIGGVSAELIREIAQEEERVFDRLALLHAAECRQEESEVLARLAQCKGLPAVPLRTKSRKAASASLQVFLRTSLAGQDPGDVARLTGLPISLVCRFAANEASLGAHEAAVLSGVLLERKLAQDAALETLTLYLRLALQDMDLARLAQDARLPPVKLAAFAAGEGRLDAASLMTLGAALATLKEEEAQRNRARKKGAERPELPEGGLAALLVGCGVGDGEEDEE